MATHNGEAHVQDQLRSIISQLEATDEVVVVDDGSTDGTVGLVEAVLNGSAARSRVIRNATPVGPRRAFALAMEAARGDYVFLSDQDDVWRPEKVATMLSALDHADLVMSDAMLVDAQGDPLAPSFYALRNSGPGLWKNFHKCTYVGCCMAFRRSVLDVALPIPRGVPMHDVWLGLIAEARFRTEFLPDRLVEYRRHAGNVTSTEHMDKRLSLGIASRRIWLGWQIAARLLRTGADRLRGPRES